MPVRSNAPPILCLAVTFWAHLAPAPAQAWQTPWMIVVSADTLAAETALTEAWRYRPGDDPAWAAAELDDSSWENVDPRLRSTEWLASGWDGIGWFRLHLRLDPALTATPVAAYMQQWGASEVYLDGNRIGAWGAVAATPGGERAVWSWSPPWELVLEPDREHVLAIRYSNHAGHDLGGGQGFQLYLGGLDAAVAHRDRLILGHTKEAMFLAGAGAAFAVLHLLLFIFSPQVKANLFFALFTASLAGLYWTDTRSRLSSDPEVVIAWFKGDVLFGTAMLIAAIPFAVFAAGRRRIPFHFYLLLVAGAGVVGWTWLQQGWPDLRPCFVFSTVALLETLRILGLAIYRRRRDVWLIGLGFVFWLGAALAGHLVQGGLGLDARLAVSAGLLGLLISASVYLARGVARTRRELLDQELENQRMDSERRLLEAGRATTI